MNETQMRAELIRIIENNNQFTTWTVSTPHIMMLIDKAVEDALEKLATLYLKLLQVIERWA